MGLEGLKACMAEFEYKGKTIILASQTQAKNVKTDDESTHFNILTEDPEWEDVGQEAPTKNEIERGRSLADRIDTDKAEILINCKSGVFRSAIVAIHLLKRLGATTEIAKQTVFRAQGKDTNKTHMDRVNQFFPV